MPTLEVGSASGVAQAVLNQPPQFTSGTARLLHRALLTMANEAAEARAYAPGVTTVTLHVPIDVVAVALRRHRVSVWRAAKTLKHAGLLDFRPHKTTVNGRVVNDGTLWAVALRPLEGGVKLSYDDLKHQGWRDLAGDIERGRTAHAAMQQSKDPCQSGIDLQLLREWTMPPAEVENARCMIVAPVPRHDLEAVLDVQHAARSERPAMVEAGADALCAALRDAGGRRFYMALLWALLRLQDSTGAAPWYQVYQQAARARADGREGFARKPGALLVSRLKTSGLLAELMNAPPNRVGVKPLKA